MAFLLYSLWCLYWCMERCFQWERSKCAWQQGQEKAGANIFVLAEQLRQGRMKEKGLNVACRQSPLRWVGVEWFLDYTIVQSKNPLLKGSHYAWSCRVWNPLEWLLLILHPESSGSFAWRRRYGHQMSFSNFHIEEEHHVI